MFLEIRPHESRLRIKYDRITCRQDFQATSSQQLSSHSVTKSLTTLKIPHVTAHTPLLIPRSTYAHVQTSLQRSATRVEHTKTRNVRLRLPTPATSELCSTKQPKLLSIVVLKPACIRTLNTLPSLRQRRTIERISSRQLRRISELWLRIISRAAWSKRSDGYGAVGATDRMVGGIRHRGI